MEARFPFADAVNIPMSIPDFTIHKTDSRLYSHTQSCGGYLWRLLVFPNGNRVPDVLSVYLDFVGRDDTGADSSLSAAASSSSSICSAQASDAPLRTPVREEGEPLPGARVSPVTPATPAPGEGEDDAAAEYAPVVEARVWFSVVPAPPAPMALEDASSVVVSTASEDDCEKGVADTADETGEAGSESEHAGGSLETEGGQGMPPVLLKDCSHRFTSPDNDWGFRELITKERASRFVDGNGCLNIKAHVVVFGETYTSVRDRILASCSSQRVNWLDIVPLVQEHERLAANAPTRVGISTHSDGASLLHAACKDGSLSYAALLVARGASVEVEDDSGRTPLFYAARSGVCEVVEWLVEEHEVPVNARDSENRSALFFACEEGKLDVVQYLVEKDADYKTADYDGDTPARLAEGRGHVDVTALLRSLG